MLNLIQTIILSIIQGLTELFPVSSVAHNVLAPYVFHWNLSQEFLKQKFLPFVVMLHLGTAVALLLYFGKEWIRLILSIFNWKKNGFRLLVLLVVATIPAGIIGVVLQHPLTRLFSSVTSASIFLIVNGFFLFFGEKLKSKGTKEIEELTMGQAVVIGLFQSLALVPGFSRSGSSMVAGFWTGLKHEAAAKFSMLLATPIIAGAAILEVPKLMKSGSTHLPGLMTHSLIGGVLSGVFALISVWILMHWFKKNEISAMRPFAYYCWAVGIIILISKFV